MFELIFLNVIKMNCDVLKCDLWPHFHFTSSFWACGFMPITVIKSLHSCQPNYNLIGIQSVYFGSVREKESFMSAWHGQRNINTRVRLSGTEPDLASLLVAEFWTVKLLPWWLRFPCPKEHTHSIHVILSIWSSSNIYFFESRKKTKISWGNLHAIHREEEILYRFLQDNSRWTVGCGIGAEIELLISSVISTCESCCKLLFRTSV